MTKQRRNFYLLVCSNHQHYQFSCTVSMENCHCHQLPLLLLPPWLIIILSLQSNQVFRPCISGEGVYHLHGCWTSLSSFALPSSGYVSGHLIVFNVINLQDHDLNHHRCHQTKLSFSQDCGDMLVQRADCCPVCRTDITDVVHFFRCWRNISPFFIQY